MIIDKLGEKLKQTPRDKDGDTKFTSLEQVQTLFTNGEITELVNRALYQLEYQSKSHAKYQQKRRELEQPVRDAFKRLYPTKSFAKATDEEFKSAIKLVKEEREQK